MAQTNYTPISLYYSTTASAVPTAANLVPGELAINTNDGKLYYEDSSGVVQVLASKAGALGDVVGPASATDNALARFDLTTGKLIQNSIGILTDAGALSGLTGLTSSGSITLSSLTSGRVTYAGTAGLLQDDADFTFNGTTVTMANDASISGLTVGKGGGAVANNTVLGNNGALSTNSTGTGLTAVGGFTLKMNTADYNSAFGWAALQANTSGTQNAAFGTSDAAFNATLGSNTTGSYNNAFGNGALARNTTGANNTALGHQSLSANTTGSYNTAVGWNAGISHTTGIANTFIGVRAGVSATTGSYNTFVGSGGTDGAGAAITTGGKNTILGGYTGNQGGLDIRTASNHIVLSDGDGNPRIVGFSGGNVGIGNVVDGSLPSTGVWIAPSYDATNSSGIAIGHANGSGSGDTYMGFIYNATKIGSITQSGTTAVLYNITSDQRLKTNIVDAPSGNINNIKVRSFDWVTDGNHQTYGLVAQELLEVAPYAVHQPQNSEEMMAVDYSKLVPMMIKEIQDLKARLTALENK